MGNNSSRQNGLVRSDASNDKPAEAGGRSCQEVGGIRGKALPQSTQERISSKRTGRGRWSAVQSNDCQAAARPGLGRLLGNRRGIHGDTLPADHGAEKSPSVITLYSYDGISAAGASATPSASSVLNSDTAKASSTAVARSCGLACDVSSEPFLAAPNRTTTLTSLSVLALPSQEAPQSRRLTA